MDWWIDDTGCKIGIGSGGRLMVITRSVFASCVIYASPKMRRLSCIASWAMAPSEVRKPGWAMRLRKCGIESLESR